MVIDEKKCVLCNSQMEEGFILEFKWHMKETSASQWVQGEPEKTMIGQAAYTDRPRYHITAYRCEKCGHIDLFAINPPWK